MDRKRELIRELTNSAWSILASYERDERAGRLTRQEAQDMAKARIEALRYGREGKDYFWLQDMHPRIVMHPYRLDLNGQDVSSFTDPRGVRIFVEFADLVRRKQAGYIEYVWQWLDDPQRMVPKESYVKGFEPWGWVIGTGIYIDDVKDEIARVEQSLVVASLVISGGVILLLLFVVQQSLRIERERREVEESLRESTERYRSLVEATTEGALLVLDDRCRYANPTLLRLLGYSIRQLELLDLSDLLPHDSANETAWERIRRSAGESNGSGGFEGILQRADGNTVECVMVLNTISFAGSAGFILLVLSAICDAAAERFIALSVEELGPPPAPFVFIAMGSHGRQEQTLLTDQDNAIIFAAQDSVVAQTAVADYFLRLGSKVCEWLEQAGYPACRGQFMASNPRWCQPLPRWKQYFTDWIVRAEPQELLEFSIFFDFRAVYGDATLAQALRRHVHDVLNAQPAFFPHLARSALLFTPPFRLFGSIYLGGGSMEHAGQLNLKDTLMSIVDFARLYALRHKIDHTHTLDRIDALVERNALLPASRDEVMTSYDFLMRLRLQQQLDALQKGQALTNTINLRHIRHMEEMLLRQAFAQIAAAQKKINYDFFGTAVLGTA